MKLTLNLTLFLLTMVVSADKSLSLTDYQIRKTCQKEKNKLTCVKTLKEKRFILQKGNHIEIPVIPYKRKSY